MFSGSSNVLILIFLYFSFKRIESFLMIFIAVIMVLDASNPIELIIGNEQNVIRTSARMKCCNGYRKKLGFF